MEDNIEKPDFEAMAEKHFEYMKVCFGDLMSKERIAVVTLLGNLWHDHVSPLQSRILELQKDNKTLYEGFSKAVKEISELKAEIERLKNKNK